jgi:Cu/Ag efflux pump CusA
MPAPPAGDALIDGKPAIVLVIAEQFQANTLAVTRAVEKVLKDLEPSLKAEGVILHPALFRSANFIETAVGHLRVALLAGALLVIAVLFLFLFNVRTALISALAIPLSLLTAVIVLDYFGIGLNTMTLGGLAIALGEVVDDAIIDVENIFRRLRENRMFAQPLPLAQVVLNASVEVRGSVVYATFIVALVFVPALMLSALPAVCSDRSPSPTSPPFSPHWWSPRRHAGARLRDARQAFGRSARAPRRCAG